MSSPTSQPASNAPAETTGSQSSAVPIWLIVVLFMLLYWGAVYFDEHGGWFEPRVYGPYVSAEELKKFQVAGGSGIMDQGAAVYGKTCIACHQPNGMGTAGSFPPLVGSDWVKEKDPGRIIRLVLQGFTGPGLLVNGQPFPTSGTMITMAYLSDEDIAAVLTYVRGNPDWGNHAPPVTPEQVKAIREKVQKTHPQPFYSPAEIMQINPAE
jgi:nitrite reductase (NO-forming)